MLYELRLQRDGHSVESALAKGRQLPGWFTEGDSESEPQDEFFMKAFWDLCTCRQYGQSLGPIPWRDIIEYARFSALDDDVTQLFIVVMRHLDNAYLKWHAAEAKRLQDANKPETKRGTGRRS